MAPDQICFGEAEAMIAEVGALDVRQWDATSAFFVLPVGDAQWDTEGFATRREAADHARYLGEALGAPVAAVH